MRKEKRYLMNLIARKVKEIYLIMVALIDLWDAEALNDD